MWFLINLIHCSRSWAATALLQHIPIPLPAPSHPGELIQPLKKNHRPFWKGYFWPQQLFEPAHIPSPGAGAVSHGKRMAQGSRCGWGLGIGSSLTRPSPLCCSRHQPQLLVRMVVLSLCRGMFWGGFSLPLCTHAGLPSWPCTSENIARGAQSVLVRACTVPKKLFCRKTLSKMCIQAKWCLPSFLPMFFSIFSHNFVHNSVSPTSPCFKHRCVLALAQRLREGACF